MQLSWRFVEKLFQNVDYPVWGDGRAWDRWYEEAWTHFVESGLAEAETPIDGVRIKLRILALCWLAHDFCSATYGDRIDLYWTDLGESLEIEPLLAIVSVADGKTVRQSLADAVVLTERGWFADEEEALATVPDELTDDLTARITAYAAFRHRDEVVEALLKGFGDMSMLFASMYANCRSDEQVISEREDELMDIRDAIVAEIETAVGRDDLERLQSQLRLNSQQLERDALLENAITEKRKRALMDDLYVCDDESDQRMKGFQWFDEGCPVELLGYPELGV
jgi:hypothetical protein